MAAEAWWVTWSRNTADGTAARESAQVWEIPDGGQPPQLSDMFLAGPFADQADAQKYKNAIGTGAILPPGGTPIVGSLGRGTTQTIQDVLGGFNLGSWFLRIGEILLGLVLIGVGLAKITNAVPLATKIAGAVK